MATIALETNIPLSDIRRMNADQLVFWIKFLHLRNKRMTDDASGHDDDVDAAIHNVSSMFAGF